MLKIEVERHEGAYFEPYIDDYTWGCLYHFHVDDITEEGAAYLAQACTGQSLRWAPLRPGETRGTRIPITMDRRTTMPDSAVLVVDDKPDSIRYTMLARLITQRGGDAITRLLSERSPHWGRIPAPHTATLRAV